MPATRCSCRRAIRRSSQPLVKELGARAHVGTPSEAAAFGSVVLVSIPYGAMPQIGGPFRAELAGKVIIDTSNPVERRDGAPASSGNRKGAGVATAELLQERPRRARVQLHSGGVARERRQSPARRIAIPIGGDDAAALELTRRLVREAGFDPVSSARWRSRASSISVSRSRQAISAQPSFASGWALRLRAKPRDRPIARATRRQLRGSRR